MNNVEIGNFNIIHYNNYLPYADFKDALIFFLMQRF
jgi:hypothetical protein